MGPSGCVSGERGESDSGEAEIGLLGSECWAERALKKPWVSVGCGEGA